MKKYIFILILTLFSEKLNAASITGLELKKKLLVGWNQKDLRPM